MTEPLHHANVVPIRGEAAHGPALVDRDDDALMLIASAGRRDAFRILVERHGARVFRFCVRMTNDRTVAEELAQETWLAVWNARASYQPQGQFIVWLLVAARHRCFNASRGSARRARVMSAVPVEATEETASEDPAQLDRLIAAEERRRATELLAELPAPMREAVVLRYADALAYEQIAEVTGVNASTARSRVFHAVRRLADLLSRDRSTKGGLR